MLLLEMKNGNYLPCNILYFRLQSDQVMTKSFVDRSRTGKMLDKQGRKVSCKARILHRVDSGRPSTAKLWH
jgi:hypothetical protein